MKIEEISEIYAVISECADPTRAHGDSIALRKKAFHNLNSGFVKVAFDTRRINQETDYIARRGLQNYNRSDQFITEATVDKLKNLKRLKKVLEDIKAKYGQENTWHDSYCRVLLDTIDRALRTEQKDDDFTDSQPGVGSIDYLEEMLFVRYRIILSSVTDMDDKDIMKKLLSKDPELFNQDMNDVVAITKKDVGHESYDTLLEKLFGGVKATKENPEVERTVTITIKDKFVE